MKEVLHRLLNYRIFADTVCQHVLTEDNKELISLCSATDLSTDSGILTICSHHKKLFLDEYEFLQKNCCDPFSVCTKSAKCSLYTLEILKAERVNSFTT